MRSISAALNAAHAYAATAREVNPREWERCPSCGAAYRPSPDGNGRLLDWCLTCGNVTARVVAARAGATVAPKPARKPYPERKPMRPVSERVYRTDLVCRCGREKTIRDERQRVPRDCDRCAPRAAKRREYEAARRARLDGAA